MNRRVLIKFHLLLTGLVSPILLVYLVGGLFYTVGSSGKIEKSVIEIQRQDVADVAQLVSIIAQTLQETGTELPDADPTIKITKKGKFKLKWDNLATSITFIQAKTDNRAKIIIRNRSLLTQVMKIHRASAGSIFKAISIFVILGLLITMLTGTLMALSIPKHRLFFLKASLFGLSPFAIYLFVYLFWSA